VKQNIINRFQTAMATHS